MTLTCFSYSLPSSRNEYTAIWIVFTSRALPGCAWNVKDQYCKMDLSVGIPGIVEDESEAAFGHLRQRSIIAVMLTAETRYCCQYARERLLSVEDYQSRFCIAPAEVSQQLVQSCCEPGWSPPELALPNEDTPAVHLKQYVGLSIEVEGLSRSPALEDAV